MADVKITGLPPASAANATDQLEASQAGISRRITLGQVAAALPPATWTDIAGKPASFPPDPEAVDDRVAALLVAGANVTIDYNDVANTLTVASTAAGGGGGTVTSASVASANGFAGTVATATTTPAITMRTTISGMLKGNATAISAATAGTDYMTPANVSAAYQPLDADLTALAGLNATAGLVEQTAAAAFTKRLIGVANATDVLTRAGGDARYAAITGALLQTVTTQTGAMATGTPIIPFDDTIPQITEGTQFMTLAITPKSAASTLVIDVTWNGASSNATAVAMVAALFQDSTANALAVAVSPFALANADIVQNIKFTHVMASGSTAARTFRVRAGGSAAGTTTFNGFNAGRSFGGVFASSIVIREVAP